MNVKIPLIIAFLVMAISCRQFERAATAIYFNGKIWTGDSTQPWATSIAIREGKIIHAGDLDEKFRSSTTLMIDLKGKLVVPGFIDNHTHFLQGGYNLTSVDLKPATSKETFIALLKKYCAQYPDDRWILGGTWDHEGWGGQLPEKSWIDSICGKHPVFLSRYDGHMALANSKALNLAGINPGTPSPDGGTIQKDPQGDPTGILKDGAMDLIDKIIPEPDERSMDEYFEHAQQHAISLGVTQVHDVCSFGGWNDLKTFQRNRNNNKQQIRIYSFVPLREWQKLDSFCRLNGKGDDLLRWGGLKGYVDGSLGSTTAWFYHAYLDAPGNTGFPIVDSLVLEKQVIAADKAGLQVAVHAIGDRANDLVLRIYSKATQLNGLRDRRFRVEHAQHLRLEAIAAFAAQKVIASMQPYHAIDDGRWAYKRLDEARLRGTYAFNSLIQAGALLTFGSDWFVAPLDPIMGIYAAVTRRTLDEKNPSGWHPEQKISVEQALKSYTANNAYAGFMEDRSGKISKGYLADFVVLSDNLFTIAPEKIRSVKVERTIINGKEVFSRVDRP